MKAVLAPERRESDGEGVIDVMPQVGLSGHAVFPTLRNDMEDRRLYPRVLDFSYSALITIYLSIATIGYLMYGDACQEEITLNLGYSFASQLAVWVVVINPITKFALDMVRTIPPKPWLVCPRYCAFPLT